MKTLLIALTMILSLNATAKSQSPNQDALGNTYTKAEISSCSVIVDANRAVCDPDGNIDNGDLDAAE